MMLIKIIYIYVLFFFQKHSVCGQESGQMRAGGVLCLGSKKVLVVAECGVVTVARLCREK